MLRQLTQFKSVISGIENFFHFDANCPTNIAKESLFECLKWIGQIEDAAKASQPSSDPSIEQVEEEKPEVTDGE